MQPLEGCIEFQLYACIWVNPNFILNWRKPSKTLTLFFSMKAGFDSFIYECTKPMVNEDCFTVNRDGFWCLLKDKIHLPLPVSWLVNIMRCRMTSVHTDSLYFSENSYQKNHILDKWPDVCSNSCIYHGYL